MFILYGLVFGVVAGLLVRGRLSGLATLRFRWAPLALVGFAAQLVLFSDAVAQRVGELGPALYVGSTALVLVAVVRNVRMPGMALVAAGAACNLAAIVANGGYMPTTAEAMAQLGRAAATVYSNSAVMPSSVLPWLTDIFAMPRWMPFANVYSLGDVLIGTGIAATAIAAMRSDRRAETTPPGPTPGPEAAPVPDAPDGRLAFDRRLLPPPKPSAWQAGPLVPALSLAVVTLFFVVAALSRGRV